MRYWMRRAAPHEPQAPVVECRHVTVRYNGDPPALADVSCRLSPGEHVAIVGPNGAGKSTLLKVVAGILPPTSGEVDVYGHQAGGHICIGYVPQRSQVDLKFPVTVSDVVLMGRIAKMGLFRQASRRDWALVHESLALVGMQDLAGRQIGELSGGQQQRAFIARAMAQEAELLLMDEPLTGLDVPSQEAIFGILETLRTRHMTILVSTHDLHQAAEHFDRIMLLNHQLLALGPAAEVLSPANLQQAYGAQMTRVEGADGALVFGDTCCEGQEEQERDRV